MTDPDLAGLPTEGAAAAIDADSAPRVTAAVPTFGPGAMIADTLHSILASDHDSFEVIVVDQNPDDHVLRAIESLRHDRRLRYLHRPEKRGASRARNTALAAARTPIVAFTDDDCIVPSNWLSTMEAAFAAPGREKVLAVFCNVAPAPHDRSLGFIPAYERQGDLLVRGVADVAGKTVMGAGMALRREAALSIGGLDPCLGPGGIYQSGEDTDLSIRAVLLGHHLFETDSVAVIHHGFRTLAEGKELGRRDWFGIGAACAKPGRFGFAAAFRPVLRFYVIDGIVSPFLSAVFRGTRPLGIGRAIAFARGYRAGSRAPLNRATMQYIDPADAGSASSPQAAPGSAVATV